MNLIVAGLLFGDEGKGHTVAKLTELMGASAIVRFSGGCQAAHRVVQPNGDSHVFAQIGAGSVVSPTVKTFLTPKMAWNPVNLLAEIHVHESHGIAPLHKRLYVSSECPTTTFYHRALNRATEIHRQHVDGSRLSSVGLGVGDTFDDVRKSPELVLYAKDFLSVPLLREKLECLRKAKGEQAQKLCPEAQDRYKQELGILFDNVDKYVQLLMVARAAFIPNIKYDFEDLLHKEVKAGTAIFEGSQGTMLDCEVGTTPYITHSRTTPSEAFSYLYGFDKMVLGVTRTYAHRHGLGPLPTESNDLMYKDALNEFNEWQRDFRLGYLDIPMLRYSMETNHCFDGIILTHMDQIPDKFCPRYEETDIDFRQLALEPKVTPVFENLESPPEILEASLGLPVLAQSWGEIDTWTDIKL